MKKKYSKPKSEIEEFEKYDILTTSTTGGSGSGSNEGEWDIWG